MPSPKLIEIQAASNPPSIKETVERLMSRFSKTQLLAFFVLKKLVWVAVALYWVK
jgi:hypothetical protein